MDVFFFNDLKSFWTSFLLLSFFLFGIVPYLQFFLSQVIDKSKKKYTYFLHVLHILLLQKINRGVRKSMKGYSSVQALEGHTNWGKEERSSFWDMIESFLSSFSKTEMLEIIVPTNVYLRTKLLCEYISEKVEVYFDVSNFLMTLYLDFLQSAIEKYNPKKIQEQITRSHGYDDILLIHANDKIYEYKKREGKQTTITIGIDKKDGRKGQLLLDEMEELYGQAPSLEKLLSILWINFIEDYKAGNNQKALNDIIRMLKKRKVDEN
jgi:hypothetical protein